MTEAAMTKTAARQIGQASRKAVVAEHRRVAAQRLATTLPRHPLVAPLRPGNVLVPAHHRDEIETLPLARRLEDAGWRVHRPRTNPRQISMEAVAWPTTASLTPGAAGIPEPPRNEPAADPRLLHLILVPAIAFDRAGTRVGSGQGYFDRYLGPLIVTPDPPVLIGIGYRCQLFDHIAPEPHDIPMDGLQLEDLTLVCRPRTTP